MALYFAMIEGERKGPMRLDELEAAGVRPDTYVWCKGMDDWRKAEDVADICRYYRQLLFDRMHPTAPAPVADHQPDQARDDEGQAVSGPRGYFHSFPMPEEDPAELLYPPMPTLGVAIAVLLFCFPFTGILAVYYSIAARKEWDKSVEISEGKAQGDADNFRRRAHDSSRKAKMWVGITFFVGLIFYAFAVSLVA